MVWSASLADGAATGRLFDAGGGKRGVEGGSDATPLPACMHCHSRETAGRNVGYHAVLHFFFWLVRRSPVLHQQCTSRLVARPRCASPQKVCYEYVLQSLRVVCSLPGSRTPCAVFGMMHIFAHARSPWCVIQRFWRLTAHQSIINHLFPLLPYVGSTYFLQHAFQSWCRLPLE